MKDVIYFILVLLTTMLFVYQPEAEPDELYLQPTHDGVRVQKKSQGDMNRVKIDSGESVLVKDINPGTDSSYISKLTRVNNTLFFLAYDGIHGLELWKSDGTADGTMLVKDLIPGSESSFEDFPELANLKGTLFFGGDDGIHGRELWKSDGTEEGTVMVKDIYPGWCNCDEPFPNGSYPEIMTNVNGTLFFIADDGEHGREVWKSDGTEEGTVMVKDVDPTNSHMPYEMAAMGDMLYFLHWSDEYPGGGYSTGLWKSDGTEKGTVLLKGNIDPQNITNVNGVLFFATYGKGHSHELWKSDGTSKGTLMVKDINKHDGYGFVVNKFTSVNGTLFFSAHDGENGQELWKSDGTEEGTVMVKDIFPGELFEGYANSSDPYYLTAVDKTLFFVAQEDTYKYGLWKSDGTEEGTVKITPDGIDPDGDVNFGWLTNIKGNLFFTAYNWDKGQELWISDGTDNGTKVITDINPEIASSAPYMPTYVNGMVFFAANDGIHGHELWKMDIVPIIHKGRIKDSEDKDNFHVKMECKSFKDIVEGDKVVEVTIGPLHKMLLLSDFRSTKNHTLVYKNKDEAGIIKYILNPSTGRILFKGRKLSIEQEVINPITTGIKIGDWECLKSTDWKIKERKGFTLYKYR